MTPDYFDMGKSQFGIDILKNSFMLLTAFHSKVLLYLTEIVQEVVSILIIWMSFAKKGGGLIFSFLMSTWFGNVAISKF